MKRRKTGLVEKRQKDETKRMKAEGKSMKKKGRREKIEDLLKDKDVEVRRDAVESLKKLKDKPAVIPFLIKSLKDEDWRVRKTSVEVLLKIKGETVIKGLINTLYEKDSAEARNSAIEALINLGAEATDYLIQAFNSEDVDVRKFIIDILGSVRAIKSLPLMLKALEDEDGNVKVSAVEHLGNMKDASVVDALISVLEKGDIWLGYSAAAALGNRGGDKAVEALISALTRKPLRESAIRALGQIADIRALSSIVPFLKDESKIVREETLKALERFFHKGIVEEIISETIKNAFGEEASNILLSYIQSDKENVRIAAILLLGLLKDKRAVTHLLEISSEEELKEDAIRALVFIGKAEPESLIPFFNVSDLCQRRIICEVAGKIGADIFFEYLVHRLRDKDGHVRANASIALSNVGNLSAVTYFKPLLLDEYEDVQQAAITSLSNLREGLDIDEIIDELSDKNPVLRKNCAMLLGVLGEKEMVGPLSVALKDSDVSVRIAVVDALSSIPDPIAVKPLLQAMTDESPDVRRAAVIGICKAGTENVIEPLILLLYDKDSGVRAAAAKSLGSIKSEKALKPLIHLLSDDSGFVKASVIESLGGFKNDRVKNILIPMLRDKDAEIRRTTVEALANFDGIVKNIIPLLKDSEWAVREKVVDVLGKFFKEESYSYLKETADTDEDPQVREVAARYLGV